MRLAVLILAAFLVAPQPTHAGSCVASWYGAESGLRTANGERFNPSGYTAAHRTLPFGTMLKVCNKGCVTVRINDRGPFVRGRCLDLSRGAAKAIGMHGVGRVEFESE